MPIRRVGKEAQCGCVQHQDATARQDVSGANSKTVRARVIRETVTVQVHRRRSDVPQLNKTVRRLQEFVDDDT